MRFPKYLEEYAKENGLKCIDVVEDNYLQGTALFAIFEGGYGQETRQETRRIDENKEIVFES